MKHRIRAICVVAFAAAGSLGGSVSASAAAPQNCGVHSIVGLSALLGKPVGEDEAVRRLGGPDRVVSLLDLRNGAKELGMELEGFRLSLSELRTRGCAAILHLQKPQHFVVLAAVGAEYAVVEEQRLQSAWRIADLQRRYTGLCLIPSGADVAPQLNPRVHVDGAVRAVELPSEAVEKLHFVFRNTGGGSLDLAVLDKSCACVSVRLTAAASERGGSAALVAPGHTAVLAVEIGKRVVGSELDTVILRTNDIHRPRVVVGLLATSPKDVMVSPGRLSIRTLEGKAATRLVKLLVPRTASLGECSFRHPFMQATPGQPERQQQNCIYPVEITVADSAPAGEFVDELVFLIRDARIGRVVVPVSGFVEPDVVAEPPQAFFGMIDGRTATKRTLTVRSRSGRPFAIRSVESKAPGVAAKASCNVAGAQHTLVVEVTPEAKEGSAISDRLRVVLADGRAVEIAVFAMLRRAGDVDGSHGQDGGVP